MKYTKVKSSLTRIVVPVIAVGTVVAAGAWPLNRPAAAAAAPAAAPMDDSSVGPLLSLDHAMEALTARVTPAVVNVNVAARGNQHEAADSSEDEQDQQEQMPQSQQFFGPGSPFGQGPMSQQQQQQQPIEKGLGSGVIISPDGYIVTNYHVVQGAINISVTMSDRKIYPAKLIGTDPLTDLAVIKIEGHDLPSIPWGDSSNLRPGETVLAFGNPYGFRFSVTRGIISALNRPNPGADRRKPGEFIQTDAAINPGNSGGALVDARGEVIGINTFLYSPTGAFSGMGFAIPAEIAEPTVNDLISHGKVEHGYMGISISDVTPDNAKFFDVKEAVGAVVTDVIPNSPGSKAGLKTGDVITALDGKPVSGAGELQVGTTQKHPGEIIHLQVARKGQTLDLPVTLESANGETEEQVAQSGDNKGKWGLGLADLSPDVREQIQAPEDVHGAVVQNVRSGSPADDAGLSTGEIIVSVNRKPTSTASDVAQALSSVPAGQDALVLVWSNGGDTFRVLHPSAG